MGGLKKIIANEKAALVREGFGAMGDVTKQSKKTKEVEADKYADTLEQPIDHMKAMKVAKVQEAKLLMQLKRLREKMRYSQKKLEESKRQRKPARKS